MGTYLLFMLFAIWTSSVYHRKDKEWNISRRAQGRVEISVAMCVLRNNNSQVCKLLKDILDLQLTLFLNYLCVLWLDLNSFIFQLCTNVGCEGRGTWGRGSHTDSV